MKALLFFGLLTLTLLISGFRDGEILRRPPRFRAPIIPDDNPMSRDGVRLGHFLFYDPILSGDSTISCSSCHQQAYAFSDAGNRFSTGITETPLKRNTLPLFNLAWYSRFGWDGKEQKLEHQIMHPVRLADEMGNSWTQVAEKLEQHPFYKNQFTATFGNMPIDSVLVGKAIAQFLRTLVSADSKLDRAIEGSAILTEDEFTGFEIYLDQTRGGCVHCHPADDGGLITDLQFSNNGLDSLSPEQAFADAGLGGMNGNPKDMGKFRNMSLRNIGFTAPYMHDGRFKTLEEVLAFYAESHSTSPTLDSRIVFLRKHPRPLSKTEQKQIIAFLLTLNDSSFIGNPAFGNPFR
jgi:cytochrome c peroxidase